MDPLPSWTRFAARCAKAPPLRFVTGLRHQLKTGISCIFHSHASMEIVYHPTGRGVSRGEKNRTLSFTEGDAIIYAPHEKHDQVMAKPGEDFCLRIAVPARLRNLPTLGFRVDAVQDTSVIEDIRLLSLGCVHPTPAEQTIYNLRATSTLLALIDLAAHRLQRRESPAPERYVREAERYLREHFANIESLREAGEAAGIGYDHLRHLFRQQRGRSLVSYLNEVRLERAKTLLVHSRVPLKQVAALCGFRDEYYFSAVFRKAMRVPPGKYRLARG